MGGIVEVIVARGASVAHMRIAELPMAVANRLPEPLVKKVSCKGLSRRNVAVRLQCTLTATTVPRRAGTVTWLTPAAGCPCDTVRMSDAEREQQIAADDYRIVTEDFVLCAQLHSSLVVCLYDAVEESGALLHLRLAAPGQSRDPNLTDSTLSSDLALLDRALRELSAACPRARHWQAKLVAHTEEQASARVRCEGLQAFISAFLQDAGIEVVSAVAHAELSVAVRFRPAMGHVRTLTANSSTEG